MYNGYTRDIHLDAFARNIWLLTAQYNTELSVCLIADFLSRWCHLESDIGKLNKWVESPNLEIITEDHFKVNYEI